MPKTSSGKIRRVGRARLLRARPHAPWEPRRCGAVLGWGSPAWAPSYGAGGARQRRRCLRWRLADLRRLAPRGVCSSPSHPQNDVESRAKCHALVLRVCRIPVVVRVWRTCPIRPLCRGGESHELSGRRSAGAARRGATTPSSPSGSSLKILSRTLGEGPGRVFVERYDVQRSAEHADEMVDAARSGVRSSCSPREPCCATPDDAFSSRRLPGGRRRPPSPWCGLAARRSLGPA